MILTEDIQNQTIHETVRSANIPDVIETRVEETFMFNPQAVPRPLDTTQEDLDRRISEDLQQTNFPFRISPLYSGYQEFLALERQLAEQSEQSERGAAAEQPESRGDQGGEGATGGAGMRYSESDPADAPPRK